MGKCLRCGTEIRLGGLCPAHAEALATCADVTADQIRCEGPPSPAACLIDQWGHTHSLPDRALVGRLQGECALSILHHTVSAVHALIERAGPISGPGDGDGAAPWRVVDRGSLNGTFVEDEQVRSAPLRDGDRVRFGKVSFFFAPRSLPSVSHQPGAGYTVPTRARDIAFHARVEDASGRPLALVQRAAGGIVRIDDDTALEFARLEFALLKILAERRMERGDPELAFVSSQELAELLDFKSQDADGENVRELVRRVRRKFKAEGIADLIESRQGVGYRLAWSVKD
jgi:pSer/pThr/pTyr-binding forkhead associated (FHA) protein